MGTGVSALGGLAEIGAAEPPAPGGPPADPLTPDAFALPLTVPPAARFAATAPRPGAGLLTRFPVRAPTSRWMSPITFDEVCRFPGMVAEDCRPLAAGGG